MDSFSQIKIRPVLGHFYSIYTLSIKRGKETKKEFDFNWKEMDLNHPIDPQSDAACDPWKVKAAQAALAQGIISEEDTYMVLLYNLSRFRYFYL